MYSPISKNKGIALKIYYYPAQETFIDTELLFKGQYNSIFSICSSIVFDKVVEKLRKSSIVSKGKPLSLLKAFNST